MSETHSDSSTISPALVKLPVSPSEGGRSFATPPSFEESQSAHALLVLENPTPDADLEEAIANSLKGDEAESLLLPPNFSEYQAEYSTRADGTIVSHDKHLNEDGETLYRFLLAHASTRPTLLLRCRATHEEWQTRQITRYEDGKSITTTETVSQTIVDFDFTIDCSQAILPAPPDGAPIWIIGDKDAVFRGSTNREVDSIPTMSTIVDGQNLDLDLEAGQDGRCCKRTTWRRRATKQERNSADAWKKRHEDWGFAPWVLLNGQIRGTEASVESGQARYELQHSANGPADLSDDSVISAPTKTLRDWADEYGANKKLLKEFNIEKVVYGWNLHALRQAVENTIRANYVYPREPTVTFKLEGAMISVRPSNWYSRILSNNWLWALLWVTLIYPLIIWPFKMFSRRGGGEWRVAGSAFALTKWQHLPDSIPGESMEQYRERTNPILIETGVPGAQQPAKILKVTPKGLSELVGQREGEWFAMWEDTIAGFVRQRYVSTVPVTRPLGTFRTAGIGLDGYYPQN